MMTTKVFQRVLATFLVAAAILLANGLNNVTNAARVQIYDGSVNDILNDIKNMNESMKNDNRFSKYHFTLRGTHYWNDKKSFRYCESYFGDSDKNRLIFQVNNNGAVSSAWIIVPVDTMSGEFNKQGAEISGLLLGSIFDVIGLSDSESDNIMDNFKTWLENNYRILSEADEQKINELYHNYDKTFSVWCTKSKRYIDLSISIDKSTEPKLFRYFITAHI